MSAELVPHIQAPANLEELQRLAKLLHASGYFKGVRDMAQACVKIMAGQELGLSPIASLQGIHFINDRLCYESVILASALKRRGYAYTGRSDKTGASITFFDSQERTIGVSQFGPEDAAAAGLNGKDVYKKWAQDMYWARAMSRGCRRYCADVFGGPVYAPEDFDVPTAEVSEHVETVGSDAARDVPTNGNAKPQSDATVALQAKLEAKRAAMRGEGVTPAAVAELVPLGPGESDGDELYPEGREIEA